jgi:hypothetical protein
MEVTMRKIGMMLAMLVCAVMAQAGEYAYLVFVNQSNDTTALSVTGMTLKVNENSLMVTNTEGTVNFTLTDLQFMQFMTEDGQLAQRLDNILDANAPIDVYTILGVKVGHYNSLPQAAGVLGKGSYVITNGRISQTIVVK